MAAPITDKLITAVGVSADALPVFGTFGAPALRARRALLLGLGEVGLRGELEGGEDQAGPGDRAVLGLR